MRVSRLRPTRSMIARPHAAQHRRGAVAVVVADQPARALRQPQQQREHDRRGHGGDPDREGDRCGSGQVVMAPLVPRVRERDGGHLGHVPGIDERDLGVRAGDEEGVLAAHPARPAQQVRHQERRSQERPRHAAAPQVVLDAAVGVEERDRRADVRTERRQLHDVPHTGRGRGVDHRRLPRHLLRVVRAGEEDPLDARDGRAHRGGVAEVADRELGVGTQQPVRLLRVAHERPHRRLPPPQLPHDVRADRSGRAGDEDGVHREPPCARPAGGMLRLKRNRLWGS